YAARRRVRSTCATRSPRTPRPWLQCDDQPDRHSRRARSGAGKFTHGRAARHRESGGHLLEALQDESARRHRPRRRRRRDRGRRAERHPGDHHSGAPPPMKSATVFAPGSVGNVGPGFDILGLAIDGIGDRVTAQPSAAAEVIVRGVDANLVPTDPAKNAAAIAAYAMVKQPLKITIDKGLPVSAGLGGSASSSVAGAYAAALACGVDVT